MEARKLFSRVGWAFVAFCLVNIAVQLLIGAGIGAWIMLMDGAMPDMDTLLLSQVCMYVFAFPVFWLMMRRIPSWHKPEGEKLSLGSFLMWAVVCFGFTYIGNFIGQFLMWVVGMATGNPPANPVMDMLGEMNPWVMILTTVVIAPVMEELMFRKFLIDRLVPYGQKAAVLISGLAFGLFHGNFFQFFYACMLGGIFAYLYSSTGRIRYNNLLHMIINAVGGVVPILLLPGLEDFTAASLFSIFGSLVLVAIMVATIIGAIVLACVFGWRLPWFGGWAPRPEKGLWRAVLTAPGVIGFMAACVVMFILS